MGLDASIELSINGKKVLVVRAQPNIPPGALANMLEDGVAVLKKAWKL